MRYTVRGRLTPAVVEEALQQFAEHLTDHEVDELTSLSIYYTPYSAGRKVEFRSPEGDPIDQIIVEPVATRLYRGTGTPVRKQPLSSGGGSKKSGLEDAARAVAGILKKWRLDHFEMAILLYSHEARIRRLLDLELPFLMKREQTRLSLILRIDECFDALAQQAAIDEWLRSGATMAAFEGATPLHQLLSGGEKALARMMDALNALSEECWRGVDCPAVVSGFDKILDKDESKP